MCVTCYVLLSIASYLLYFLSGGKLDVCVAMITFCMCVLLLQLDGTLSVCSYGNFSYVLVCYGCSNFVVYFLYVLLWQLHSVLCVCVALASPSHGLLSVCVVASWCTVCMCY